MTTGSVAMNGQEYFATSHRWLHSGRADRSSGDLAHVGTKLFRQLRFGEAAFDFADWNDR